MIDNAPRVLCACEESQAVTERMRKMGIEAYSCDLLPTSGKHPEWHIQADALQVIKIDWDAVIAFPPCTHLAVSGARWFEEKRRDGRQQMGIGFFLAFTAIDHVPHVAIENPVGIMSNLYRKPDQIIQPYQFGEPETKATCLWLKNLPKLVPTKDVHEEMEHRSQAEAHRILSMSPSPQRAMMRSKTYPGIADSMAKTWGQYLLEEKEMSNDTD